MLLITPLIILLVLCYHTNIVVVEIADHTKFHQDNALVWFSPWVTKWAVEESHYPTVIRMLTLVSQRFRKIVLRTLNNKDQKIANWSYAVAADNSLHGNSSHSLLEAHLVYTEAKVKTDIANKTILFFDFVLETANNANKEFQGTVTTLYFEPSIESGNTYNYGTLKAIIIGSIARLENSNIKYKLGLLIHVTHVGSLSWYMKKSKDPFLLNLQTVILEVTLNDKAVDPPEKMFLRVVTRFSDAKKLLQESMNIGRTETPETLEFVLMTGYRGVPGNRDATVVKFWRIFNDWIIQTNNSVVFYEAFDTFNPADNLHERGWWKLTPNKTYKTFEDFEFQEKEAGLLNQTYQNSSSFATETPIVHTYINVTNEDIVLDAIEIDNRITIFGVVGSVIIFTLVALTVLMVYLYNRAKYATIYANRMIKKEVKWFLNQGADANTLPKNTNLHEFSNLRYNRSLEIPKENFVIDKLNILGSGNKSVVCLGKITIYEDNEEINAAVKMTNINSSEMDILEMVNEIRVLSYLGKNPYIIKLLGAYTSEASKGNIYVFLEFCMYGSLEGFLKQLNSVQSDDNSSQHEINRELSNDIFQWSSDIAHGMCFLFSKRIVHGDLATRNILLNRDRRAIICDFGLSCFLDVDKRYVKMDGVDIPWRWAAPELISDKIVNEKTDVWSYGVTLWEIFTLGDAPYPDILDGDELLQMLKNGRRLPEPIYCPYNMYPALITHCFSFHPLLRPTFQEIMGFFDAFGKVYENVP